MKRTEVEIAGSTVSIPYIWGNMKARCTRPNYGLAPHSVTCRTLSKQCIHLSLIQFVRPIKLFGCTIKAEMISHKLPNLGKRHLQQPERYNRSIYAFHQEGNPNIGSSSHIRRFSSRLWMLVWREVVPYDRVLVLVIIYQGFLPPFLEFMMLNCPDTALRGPII